MMQQIDIAIGKKIQETKLSETTRLHLGLVSLAFAGSIGMTFVILACALPQYKVWWPFFVVLFYVLSPIPTMIARRHTDSAGGANSPCMESAIFLTMGLIVSSFALPIVLARASVIMTGACYLTLAGNVIVYLTIIGFFTIFDMDDSDYAMW
ncbi:leptin receptor gene-related protein isoform X1 [Plutella xylostella]|uniref:leptin receptor gene-related protein isoform X1 n=1 Tax=Plutella xylostella TaxID=51655 RepID=UPI0005D0693E|nr:leptin receptor gene-related protein isoform X1 [Plutella xylostella]